VTRVALKKNLARAVRSGHPWIYRDALRPGPPLPDGALVLVTTGDGRPLGRGFWTATTPIAVRMLTTDPGAEIGSLVPARLVAALDRRLAVLDLGQTNAFRWVHGEADLLPGLHLDVYGAHGSLRFDGSGARAFYRDLPAAIVTAAARIPMTTLVERRVGRRSARRTGAAGSDVGVNDGTGDDDGDDGGDVRSALVGQPPTGAIEIRENGLLFEVDLSLGQKGGLFLDQRDNRQRVRERSEGRRVLNLFGYTGGFSVYAAAGGAESTTTVDSAAGAISAARRNFDRNHLPTTAAAFVVGDAFAYLAAAAAAKMTPRWDLVISDPPSFAPNRQAVPEALRAYRRLHRMCATVVEPGGILCAASCSSHVDEAAFLGSIEAGCTDAGRRFEPLENHGAGADHPVLDVFPEGRYLKFTIGRVT